MKRIIPIVVLHWYYFVMCLIIFACGAHLYILRTKPVYKITARLLVKGDESRMRRSYRQLLPSMRDVGLVNNSSGIDNEVEVLQSRSLLREVVKDLKLSSDYRLKGRLRDSIVYQTHPVSVELDPAHLDSLDKVYIEEDYITGIILKLSRQEGAYVARGASYQADGSEVLFQKSFRKLPFHFETPLGTLMFTGNPGREWKSGEVYAVTILPPMVVATQYLFSMKVDIKTKETYSGLWGRNFRSSMNIANLTLADQNVRRGAEFLSHLVDCYNRQATADKNEIALRTEEFINDCIVRLVDELGTDEDQIESYRRDHDMTGIAINTRQVIRMSDQFSTRLAESNSEIQMLDYLHDYLNDPNNKHKLIPAHIGLKDRTSAKLIADYNKAVQERNRLLKAASEQSPQVQSLTTTIEELQSGIQTALHQTRNSAEINHRSIESEFAKYQSSITGAPVQERVLKAISRQKDVKSKILIYLLNKREENMISLAATAMRGKLIDEPVCEGEIRPKRLTIWAVALSLGFALPFGIIWLLSLLRYRIEGREDVERLTNLSIVADIPMASDEVKREAGIVVFEDENTPMKNVFQLLRTNIHFMLKPGGKVVLFTSNISGEGKTFCAANLAVTFALLDKKVLLCGVDIRKPALGALFGVPDRHKGITTLLTKGSLTMADVEEQIVNSGVNEHLDLLLAGIVPPNPAELLARDSFRQVIALLKEKYDYVILDTAPVGLVTDTLQISACADVTVLVCRADYTMKSSLGYLDSLCSENKLKNACMVLNGIDMSRRKYRHYYSGYALYGNY